MEKSPKIMRSWLTIFNLTTSIVGSISPRHTVTNQEHVCFKVQTADNSPHRTQVSVCTPRPTLPLCDILSSVKFKTSLSAKIVRRDFNACWGHFALVIYMAILIFNYSALSSIFVSAVVMVRKVHGGFSAGFILWVSAFYCCVVCFSDMSDPSPDLPLECSTLHKPEPSSR